MLAAPTPQPYSVALPNHGDNIPHNPRTQPIQQSELAQTPNKNAPSATSTIRHNQTLARPLRTTRHTGRAARRRHQLDKIGTQLGTNPHRPPLSALRPNIEDLNGIPYHSCNCCRPYIGDFTEPRCRYVQRVISRLGPSACATNVVSPLPFKCITRFSSQPNCCRPCIEDFKIITNIITNHFLTSSPSSSGSNSWES